MDDHIFNSIMSHKCFTPQVQEILDKLLSGCDINQMDSDGFTLLYLGVLSNKIDLVKYLLDHGADIDIICNYQPCLHASIEYDDMFELVFNRSDKYLNFPDECGSTPLHCAVINGSLKVIQTILDHGADRNIGDTIGQTPLHYITRRLDLKVVQLLLNNGADPDSVDIYGDTPKDVLIKYLDRKDEYIIGPNKDNILEIIKLLDSYSRGIRTKRAK